jgi:hypothetical protein
MKNYLYTHAIKVFEGVWGSFFQEVPHNRVPPPDKSKSEAPKPIKKRSFRKSSS